jgi:hypothetical protein
MADDDFDVFSLPSALHAQRSERDTAGKRALVVTNGGRRR